MSRKLIFFYALALSSTIYAADYVYDVNNLFATVPDGDLNGYQNSQNLAGLQGPITDVNVTLNLTSGFNGDFYAYLLHGGSQAVLLNRAGRWSTSSTGYPDQGFGPDASANRFTFDDQAPFDVHLYRTFSYSLNPSGQLTGRWQPDARSLSPLSGASLFDTAPRSNPLNIFNGTDPNGLWTLFIADLAPGNEGTLVSWGLEISVVPEPATPGLLLFGVVALSWRVARRKTRHFSAPTTERA